MPERRTPASKYPSKFGKARFVTAAQYLAELMCERRARKERTNLPAQFWKVEPWDTVYRQQVAAVNRIFKTLGDRELGAKAVSRFLRSDRGKTVWSLSGLWVVPHVQLAYRALVAEAARPDAAPTAPVPAAPDAPEPPRPAFVPAPSLLSKLS